MRATAWIGARRCRLWGGSGWLGRAAAGLALGVLALGLARTAEAQTGVPSDWALKPSGVAVGSKFRLLFATSTTGQATSTDIADYNTFVQTRAASGHTAIQSYSAGFRVVGCTEDVDARDNTSTTYTTTDTGVPIYWLDGNKVADDYEDFYDGSWDDEANAKNESGSSRFLASNNNLPFTGCDHDGTELLIGSNLTRALGATSVRTGSPGSSATSDGPLRGTVNLPKENSRPFYALSQVFTVDGTGPTFTSGEVPAAGTHVYITMSEDLDLDAANLPPASAFQVTSSGLGIVVVAVEVRTGVTDGLALRLARKIRSTDDAEVRYTDPTSGDDAAALQDTAGNDAASFDEDITTNNSTVLDEVKVDFAESSYAFSEDAATPTVTVVARTVENAPLAVPFVVDVQRASSELPSELAVATGGGVDFVSDLGQMFVFQVSDFSPEGGVYVARKTVTVTIIDDADVEGTEYIGLKITRGLGTPDSVEFCTVVACLIPVAILDDDGLFESATVKADGRGIDLVFREDLDGVAEGTVDARLNSAFSVTVNDGNRTMGALRASGPRKITIPYRGYGPELYLGDKVRVSYDPASAGSAALETDGDVAVESFTDYLAVTGGTRTRFERGIARSSKLVLFFATRLDESSVPAPGDFTVAVNGVRQEVLGLEMAGAWINADITLHLAEPVPVGAAVTVSYAKGANPLLVKRDGVEVNAFTGRGVQNITRDAVRPTVVDGKIHLSVGSQSILLDFSERLAGSEPPASAFTVKVNGSAVPLTRSERQLDVYADKMRLVVWHRDDGFSGPIGAADHVTLDYRGPTNGIGDLQDVYGNDVAAFTGLRMSYPQLAEPGTDPLTASVESAPGSHDGESGFEVRLAFSEAPGTLSFRTVRDHAFTVSGGSVRHARRVVQGSNRQWDVGVEPSGDGDVTLTLAPSPACGSAHAICTADGRRLETGLAVTVPGPEEEIVLLEGFFADAPAEHDGASAFTVRIAFSEPVSTMWRKMRDDVVRVAGGTATGARRVDRRKDLWDIAIAPSGHGAVTVSLESAASCGPGIACTKDRRALSNAMRLTVRGPAALSVSDARAEEGPGETMDFTVSLDRAALKPLTVDYATRDGSAAAGEDYTAASGRLTFTLGQRTKTVSVAVLDDVKNEGEETFTLVLSNVAGGRIEDGTGVGTIENDDPLQRAWLARFGRTVGGQALDAIAGRLDGAGGTQVTVGGQALILGGGAAPEAAALAEAEARVATMTRWLGHDEDEGEALARSMGAREALLASAFSLRAGGEAGSPRFGAWGRFAIGSFEGEDRDVALSGNVTSAFLGADVDAGHWLGGLAVGVSKGEGPFRYTGDADSNRETGAVESSLAALYPYARLSATERLDLWAVAGYGQGTMTITEDGGTPLETDITMLMGAAGVKGVVLAAPPEGGLALSVRSDVLWVRMDSDARRASAEDGGNLAAVDADVTRLRLIFEGSRAFAVGAAATLTPSLEVGLRHDAGDAETGTGVELGGRIVLAGAGVSVVAAARGLLVHEDAGYEEWGASASVRIDPGEPGRGLSLSVTPTWGAPVSGTERLWGAADARGLAPDGEFEAGRRLEAEAGYGIGLIRNRGVLTPFAGLILAEDGARVWRSGARWALGSTTNLALEGTRREAGAGGAAPEHRVGLTFGARW